MGNNYYKTRTAEISLEKAGYIKIKVIAGSVIDEADALDNLLVIKNLSANQKKLKLVDLRGKWKFTTKGKEVAKKNSSVKNTIARAYIIDSLLTKIMMKFFESFTRPDVPQMFFTNEKEAIKWLLQF